MREIRNSPKGVDGSIDILHNSWHLNGGKASRRYAISWCASRLLETYNIGLHGRQATVIAIAAAAHDNS